MNEKCALEGLFATESQQVGSYQHLRLPRDPISVVNLKQLPAAMLKVGLVMLGIP